MEENTKKHIAILLATYNGEKFLREQLDSLFAQTVSNWTLYIHDDGSTDHTLDIINEYRSRIPEKIELLSYPSTGGARNNFFSLLNNVDADYYLFCDQDDVWLNNKVERSITLLWKKEKELKDSNLSIKPIVVYTDVVLVNQDLEQIRPSFWQYNEVYPELQHGLADYAAVCGATGCTMCFNKEAKDAMLPPTRNTAMHDAWLFLSTVKKGGIVIPITSPTMLYRQHSDNTLGVNLQKNTLFNRLKNAWSRNREYYAMLSDIGYGSVCKFILYKIKYRIAIRKEHQ